MNDRELLELAAKAAGFAAHQWDEGMQAMRSPAKVTKYGDAHSYWNPLADDGDALRLAVKLRMVVSLASCCCCACVDWDGNADENEIYVRFGEEWPDREATDAQSATRRAIVRAAAEIARAAKEDER